MIGKDAETIALAMTVGRMQLCDMQCGRVATHEMGHIAPLCEEHARAYWERWGQRLGYEPPRELPNLKLVRRLEALMKGEP